MLYFIVGVGAASSAESTFLLSHESCSSLSSDIASLSDSASVHSPREAPDRDESFSTSPSGSSSSCKIMHLNIDQWGPAVEALVTSGKFDLYLFCEHRCLCFRKIAKRMARLGYSCSYNNAVPTKAMSPYEQIASSPESDASPAEAPQEAGEYSQVYGDCHEVMSSVAGS